MVLIGGPLSPSGFRRRGRRRGLAVGVAAGAAMGRNSAKRSESAAAQQPTEQPQDSTTDQLEELAKLHDQGVLTDEEFAAKKKQLLGL